MENLKEELLEIVEREFDEFRTEMLTNTKENIFDDCFKINFYNEVRSCLNDCELEDDACEVLIKKGEHGLFSVLWDKFLKWEDASVTTNTDTENFISEYVDYINENEEAM